MYQSARARWLYPAVDSDSLHPSFPLFSSLFRTDWKVARGTATAAQSLSAFQKILDLASQLTTGFIVLEHDLYEVTVDMGIGQFLPLAKQRSFSVRLPPRSPKAAWLLGLFYRSPSDGISSLLFCRNSFSQFINVCIGRWPASTWRPRRARITALLPLPVLPPPTQRRRRRVHIHRRHRLGKLGLRLLVLALRATQWYLAGSWS